MDSGCFYRGGSSITSSLSRCKEVEFLGHIITPEGLKTTSRLVLAVQNFQRPANAKHTRQFLGISSFYRRFIAYFAKIAKPLHQLTKHGTQFTWTDECQNSQGEPVYGSSFGIPFLCQRFHPRDGC